MKRKFLLVFIAIAMTAGCKQGVGTVESEPELSLEELCAADPDDPRCYGDIEEGEGEAEPGIISLLGAKSFTATEGVAMTMTFDASGGSDDISIFAKDLEETLPGALSSVSTIGKKKRLKIEWIPPETQLDIYTVTLGVIGKDNETGIEKSHTAEITVSKPEKDKFIYVPPLDGGDGAIDGSNPGLLKPLAVVNTVVEKVAISIVGLNIDDTSLISSFLCKDQGMSSCAAAEPEKIYYSNSKTAVHIFKRTNSNERIGEDQIRYFKLALAGNPANPIWIQSVKMTATLGKAEFINGVETKKIANSEKSLNIYWNPCVLQTLADQMKFGQNDAAFCAVTYTKDNGEPSSDTGRHIVFYPNKDLPADTFSRETGGTKGTLLKIFSTTDGQKYVSLKLKEAPDKSAGSLAAYGNYFFNFNPFCPMGYGANCWNSDKWTGFIGLEGGTGEWNLDFVMAFAFMPAHIFKYDGFSMLGLDKVFGGKKLQADAVSERDKLKGNAVSVQTSTTGWRVDNSATYSTPNDAFWNGFPKIGACNNSSKDTCWKIIPD